MAYAPNAGTVIDVIRGLAIKRIFGPGAAESEMLRLSDPAQRILKAAVGAGSLANPQWASSLADMAAAANDFLTRLDGRSAVIAMLDAGIIARAPMNTPLLTVGSGSVASIVGEGLPRPISKMSLGIASLTPLKVQSTIVVTKELITEAGTAGQAFLSRQLRIAVAQAIDVALIGQLLQGVTGIAAGTSQSGDIGKLLSAVNKSGAGRLAWIAAADVANRLTISNTLGGTSPTGVSEAYGLPLYVSSGMAAGSLALINGDQTAGDITGFGLETSNEATLNMNDAPVAPNSITPTGSPMVSLWADNSIALGMTAMGDLAAASGAVALLTAINWTAP